MHRTIFSQIKSADDVPAFHQSVMVRDAHDCILDANTLLDNQDPIGMARSLLQEAVQQSPDAQEKVGRIFDRLRPEYQRLLATSPLKDTEYREALNRFTDAHHGCVARVLALQKEDEGAEKMTSIEEFESDGDITIM